MMVKYILLQMNVYPINTLIYNSVNKVANEVRNYVTLQILLSNPSNNQIASLIASNNSASVVDKATIL